jgi:hypothetical protein
MVPAPSTTRALAPGTRRSLLVLLAGPAPPLMDHADRRSPAWSLFRAGHLPVTGEGLALALAATGVLPFDEVLGSVTKRLLVRCDAVLRTEGASETADRLVELARWEGIPVHYRAEDIIPVHRRKST